MAQQQQLQLQQQLMQHQFQQPQQQQLAASQLDVSVLLENIRKAFEKITWNINKSNVEHYSVDVAQLHLREAEILVQKLKDVLKERNLGGYPAEFTSDSTNIAAKQKQLIDNLKQSLSQRQTCANVIAKAFNDPGSKK